MKKGLVFLAYVLAVFLSIIMLSTSINAFVCTDGVSSTACVCGHTPNSFLGYGQVIIGPNTYSCDNVADGICPEDFTNGTLNGSCTTCADADCNVGGLPGPSGQTYYVNGYVRDSSGNPIPQAIVIGHPIKWNASASLDTNTSTNAAGFYASSSFITGTYYFSAQKDGYDTQLIRATVRRGANTSINFTLQDGICHEDCTNSYNRCNAACDGVTFSGGEQCTFFNNEAKLLCDNREKGTEVKLSTGGDATHASFISCCEGTPYLKFYTKADTDSNNIPNLITTQRITKHNDIPVVVTVAYWS